MRRSDGNGHALSFFFLCAGSVIDTKPAPTYVMPLFLKTDRMKIVPHNPPAIFLTDNTSDSPAVNLLIP